MGEKLIPYFSEYALMKYRFVVEMKWLKKVVGVVGIVVNQEQLQKLENLEDSFSPDIYRSIKEHEKKTNHDVKSVELAIAEVLRKNGMEHLVPFVHFGLTSEDTNNLAYGLIWNDVIENEIIPEELKLIDKLAALADNWAEIPMLSHTHGQPATPTTVGKEFAVYVSRLVPVYLKLRDIEITGKLNGATGNYAALNVVYPNIPWERISSEFVENELGLKWRRITTQVEPHDFNIEILSNLDHFAQIVKKLDTDLWFYISKEMFSQIPVEGEVGSSTMPHKINPIDGENSEGHVKLSSGFIHAMNQGLMESRMQRDLSDSCMQRYSGVIFGMILQAINQTMRILNKILPNEKVLANQLDSNWAVLAEAIQTALRASGDPEAYNELKKLTRGRVIEQADIQVFVYTNDALQKSEVSRSILDLTPEKYTGLAAKQAKETAAAWKNKNLLA